MFSTKFRPQDYIEIALVLWSCAFALAMIRQIASGQRGLEDVVFVSAFAMKWVSIIATPTFMIGVGRLWFNRWRDRRSS